MHSNMHISVFFRESFVFIFVVFHDDVMTSLQMDLFHLRVLQKFV